MWKVIRENPRAVFYAVLMHLVLLALLIFSLDWTPKISRPAGVKIPIEATLVDQSKLDAAKEKKLAEQRKVAAEKQKKVAAERKRKAEAEKKQQAAAESKRKAKLAEKKKQEQAARRKVEAEKQKKTAAEAKKKQQAEAERKRKAAAEKQKQAEAVRRREAEQALQQQLAAEQAERDQGVVAEYTAYIQEKIQQNWLRPAGSPEGLSCTVQVSLIPGGDVAKVEIIRSSGDSLFDRSVENAIFKASPMPLPKDAAMFKYFRELRLIFKPN